MKVRADKIGDDLREAVKSFIEVRTKERETTFKRELNNFARVCDIQPLQMQLWTKGEKGFHEHTLERIGRQLNKEL